MADHSWNLPTLPWFFQYYLQKKSLALEAGGFFCVNSAKPLLFLKKGLNIDKKVPFSKFCITVMESRRRSNGPVKVVFLRENKENIEYVYCN